MSFRGGSGTFSGAVLFAGPSNVIEIGDETLEGAAPTALRSDAVFAFPEPTDPPAELGAAADLGTAPEPARADHVHPGGTELADAAAAAAAAQAAADAVADGTIFTGKAVLGPVDRERSAADAFVRWYDGTELHEDGTTWSTLWTLYDAAKQQVSGGLLLSNWDSGDGDAIIRRAFAVAAGETARIIFTLHVPATAAGTSTSLYGSVGITNHATTPALGGSIGVGVNEKHEPALWHEPGMTSALAVESSTPLTAGVYRGQILIDEVYVSSSLTDADGTIAYFDKALRATHMPTVTQIVVNNRDSRKGSGVGIGPIFAKRSASTAKNRSAVPVEGGFVSTRMTRATDRVDLLSNLRIIEPADYDDRKPVPTLFFFHGSGETATSLGNANTAELVKDLAAAGFLVVADDYAYATNQAANWGAAAAVAIGADVYRFVRGHYNMGALGFLGASMGNLVALNLMARPELVPEVTAFYGMYPVADLEYQFNNNAGHKALIKSAHGFTLDADFATATAGYNPMDRGGWEFRRTPTRMSASYSDTTTPQVGNADPFLDLIRPWNPAGLDDLLQGTGTHGHTSQTDLADVLAFFNHWLLNDE